ncbi:hypothetical protein HG535_0B03880 [Zygotorulaspora mrakii]|uniref:GTP-binding protein n=1 Tax=Zygotorulaspora mrakii TaxID=42260 RepID=A0A7H9AY53_ZYGMR|nr:uncharacterized protein HG535_0B03880 [Zygotorulaspora mrakii]QLG71348.1 hypothetical protein HG535_0B03880 [Zygotorulaspora mrakii]
MEYNRELATPASSHSSQSARSFQRKIAILGARNVGKTTLTVRFVESHFVESYYPTIENEFTKIIRFKNHNYTLEILDTAGEDEFSLLNMKSLIGIKGIVLCYSVTNRSSFELIPIIWDKLVDQLGRDNLPVVVVANKIDMRVDSTKDYVTREEGIKMIQSIVSSDKKTRGGFIESSAKQDINVNEAIMMLLKKMESIESGSNSDSGDGKCVMM